MSAAAAICTPTTRLASSLTSAAQPVHLTAQPFHVGFGGQVLIRAFQPGDSFFSVSCHVIYLWLRCPGRKARHSFAPMVACTQQAVKLDGNRHADRPITPADYGRITVEREHFATETLHKLKPTESPKRTKAQMMQTRLSQQI